MPVRPYTKRIISLVAAVVALAMSMDHAEAGGRRLDGMRAAQEARPMPGAPAEAKADHGAALYRCTGIDGRFKCERVDGNI